MDYFDPPPPYSPPSLLLLQPPPPPLLSLSSQPPPTYHPPTKPPQPPTKILSPESELLLLKTILTTHPWPPSHGPPPTSLTTALSKASLWGNHPLVHSLLATHACQIRDPLHSTALHAALKGPSPELALAIFKHFGQQEWILRLTTDNNNKGDGPKMNALHLAARNGVSAAVITSLFGGLTGTGFVDERDGRGRTALHLAGRYTHREAVRGLLLLGADPRRVLEGGLWEGCEKNKRMGVLGSWGLIYQVLREEVGRLGGVLVVEEVFLGRRDDKTGSVGKGVTEEKEENEGEGDGRELKHGRYAGPSMSSTAMPLMLFSDEYQAWKEGCDALLEESRAQKERDRRNESWMLDVMGPPPKKMGWEARLIESRRNKD
ncbi:hypothetical protein QBC41DRAFT_349208 [Cercophora samala]|uniref:Ankyrin n=1 Tax=Cercophora samala TaxID=330535 RepID=A0AA40DA64_9PEZI|nr:hypothetical protein QBC41DRAFT_349208 [Cercophora samala]